MLGLESIRTRPLVVNRRRFLATAGSMVAAGLLPASVLAQAKPHTFKQGDYDVTVVSDGALVLPLAVYAIDVKPEDVARLLGASASADTFQVEASPLVLKSGSEAILIDTGSGDGFQPTAGKLAENLKAAGIDPASITKAVFTHAHPDHCWGTLDADGKPLLPNATLHMAEKEWNFWADPELAGKMPEGLRGMVTTTQAELAGMKDKIAMFKPGQEIAPGIGVLDTPGHTPGHVSFELAGGDGLIVTGDTIPHTVVYFANPDWKFAFDIDHAAAAASRKALLDQSATAKKQLVGFHWTYPGLGRAEKKDGAYSFVPAG